MIFRVVDPKNTPRYTISEIGDFGKTVYLFLFTLHHRWDGVHVVHLNKNLPLHQDLTQ